MCDASCCRHLARDYASCALLCMCLCRINLDRQLEQRHSLFLSGSPVILLNPDPVASRNTQLERAAKLCSAMLNVKVSSAYAPQIRAGDFSLSTRG